MAYQKAYQKAYQQKPNTGALFKNDKPNDNGPAYRGSLNVDGTDYWLAAWVKESKDGKKYMSLAVTPKDGTVVAKKQDEDSSIPF